MEPASRTPAFNHFWIRRMMRRSPIRCSQEHLDDRDARRPRRRSGQGRVPRGAREVARAFEANLPQGQPTPRQKALALAALCVGGMVLARAIDDSSLAQDVRDAARTHVLAASGWGE